MEQATVLYDLDCGFCRWSLGILLAWDRRGSLRPVAIQDAEGERLLASLPPERRLASWHVALPDGRLFSAGRAFPYALERLPGGRSLAWLARRVQPLVNRGYDLVARRRAVPGRSLSADSIARATQRIRARSDDGALIQDDRVAASCSR